MLAVVDGKRYAVPGDLARLEADGSVTLLGRGSTCVNTGGEKVFPEEVEGALKSCPDVFDALVIGVPDELLGQRVAALVQLREGRTADLPAIEASVREQIAGYKVPRSIWLVDTISRGAAGKPDYHWAHRHAATHRLPNPRQFPAKKRRASAAKGKSAPAPDCRSVIHAHSMAFKPYSPNAKSPPRQALPFRRPRICFRYFTFLGINIAVFSLP